MNKNVKKNALEKALNNLKSLVFSGSKNIKSTIKYKFEIVEDTEGQTIQYPALEVGAPVTIGDSEGGEVAPNGNYKIDDLTSIEVVDGVIASIDSATSEVAEDMEEDTAEVSDAVAEQVIETVEAVQEQISDLVEQIEEVKSVVEEFKKMDKNVKALTDAVAKFSKTPVNQSVTKENFKSEKDANLSRVAGILAKNKK